MDSGCRVRRERGARRPDRPAHVDPGAHRAGGRRAFDSGRRRASARPSCSPYPRATNEPDAPHPAGGRPDRRHHRLADRGDRRDPRVRAPRSSSRSCTGTRSDHRSSRCSRSSLVAAAGLAAAISASPARAPFTTERLWLVVTLAVGAAIAEYVSTIGANHYLYDDFGPIVDRHAHPLGRAVLHVGLARCSRACSSSAVLSILIVGRRRRPS